jgi:hypothetical protein
MSGSCGDDEGVVYLAHAWVPDELRPVTTGPWHWWNVYKDEITAYSQATRTALSRPWHGYGMTEVLTIVGGGAR